MASDSDESVGGGRAAGAAEPRFRDLLLQLAGGKYKDDESDSSESPVESQPPREQIVLKLRAKEGGQMESRLKQRRSDNVTMEDAIARLLESVEMLQHGKPGAAPPPPPRPEPRDATASVSREKYMRLKEKYNQLDERHSKLLDKYYWLEKEAVILMKMLIKRDVDPAPAPAAQHDEHDEHDERDEHDEPAPAAVAADTRKVTDKNRAEVGEEDGGEGAPGAGRRAARVRLAAGVHVARAQWAALQAADGSRALVRQLALALFGLRALTQYHDLDAERMAVLKDVLRQRLKAGGWAEPAARRVTPNTAPRYVQTYRAQLRYQQAKRREATAPTRTTCRECNRRFRTRSGLVAHARVHSGEEPYRCSECTASFKFHTQFNQHSREHVGRGARARVCPRCGLAFPQLAHLHWHTRRAHRGALPPPAVRGYKPVKPHPVWERVPLRDADDEAA